MLTFKGQNTSTYHIHTDLLSFYFIVIFNNSVSKRKLSENAKHLLFTRYLPGLNRSERGVNFRTFRAEGRRDAKDLRQSRSLQFGYLQNNETASGIFLDLVYEF
jgi:hypothetical protein